MPHNFVKTPPGPPNPGRWSRGRVDEIVKRHHGTLVGLFFDDPTNPTHAYVLVKDGNVDGLMADLHGHEVQVLHESLD